MFDEYPRLDALRLLVEVGGDAPLEVLRLADVDDGALLVEVLVTAGLLRDNLEYGLDMFRNLKAQLVFALLLFLVSIFYADSLK